MPEEPTSYEDDLVRVDEMIAEVEAARETVAAKLTPLLQEQARLDARHKLLKELRSTYSAFPSMDSSSQLPFASRAVTVGGISARIRSQVAEILREHGGGPMHSNDLHREFVRRGWPIPGAGKPNNITAHLSSAPGVISPQRGFWALGDSAEDHRTTTSRKSRNTTKRK